MSDEYLSPGSWTAIFSLCAHRVEGVKELSGVFLIRALIPFLKAPPSWPTPFPKVPPSSITTYGFQEDKAFIS